MAWERASGTLNPPEWSARGYRGCRSELGSGGGFARRGSPAYGCSGHWNGLRPTKTSTKGQGEVLKLTGARVRAGKQRKVVGDVGRRRSSTRCSRAGRRGCSPGSWSPRFGAWWSCEGITVVRAVRGAPAVWNRHGGPSSPELKSGSIPAMAWSGAGAASSERSLVLRRSSCGGYWWHRRGGAAGPRWRRGLGAAELWRHGGSRV